MNDPWGYSGDGKKSKGRSDSGADMSNVIMDFRSFVGGLFSNNDGGISGRSWLLGIVFLLLGYVLSGFYVVNAEERGVELVFGRYYSEKFPGLHYWFPAPIGKVVKVRVDAIRKEEMGGVGFGVARGAGEGLMLTGDENIVNIDFDVQWKISDAYSYLFRVRDARVGGTVKSAAESAMREVIGKSTLGVTLQGDGRAAVAYETKKLLQSVLDQYDCGVEVLSIQLKKVDPPEKVISAFRDVQSARADKERAINEATAYRNEVLPKAKGAAIKIKLDAEAYKSEVVNRAKGSSAKFTMVYEEYKNQPVAVRNRMYLETMEAILPDMDKFVLSDEMPGLFSYLPLIGNGVNRSGG